MRTYEIILLRFQASVHFGNASEGGGLTETLPFCRADTLFSALCQEAAMTDEKLLQALTEKAARGDIRLSSLFPWRCTEEKGKRQESYELYLPRPVLSVPAADGQAAESLQEAREQSGERKKRKKRAWIRASQMHTFLEDIQSGENHTEEEPAFGTVREDVHFNGRTGQPYFTGACYFTPDSGLYLILSLAEESDGLWLMNLIQSVGLSGIGGRRSSGSGRFAAEEAVILEGDPVYGEDDRVLYSLLNDRKAPVQMALCPVLPEASEIGTAAEGTGRLIRRGGFAFSAEEKKMIKTGNIYMMDTGSCFSDRLSGRLADVGHGQMSHPVLKYGKGLYIGIS